MAFLWSSKGGKQGEGCRRTGKPSLLPGCATTPCSMTRDILKSLYPVLHHKNSLFPGSLKSQGSKAAADWSRPLDVLR